MDWFLLEPFSVILLTQGLLSFFITLYLLSIKPKTWASWLVAIAVATLTLLLLEKVLEISLYTPLPFNLFALDELLRPIIFFALLHFAYMFLENPFPREWKIVLWLTSVFLVGNTLYQGYRVVALQGIPDHIELLFEIANLAMVLWAMGIFLRKMLIFSPHTGRIVARLVRVEGKEARALRAFALFTFAWVPLSIHSIWLGIDTPPRFTDYIVLLTLVVVIIGFVVGYINHMPEPTTFQVKLIGLALATVLTILSLTVEVVYPEEELIHQSNALLPDRQSLQFEPDEKGGYRMAHRPFRFDPDLGENVVFGGGEQATVALGFPFSYYGTSWDSVNVTGNGVVAFGGRFQPQAFDEFYNELPKIAPLFIDLIRAPGGVFFKQDSSKATVTWHQVAQFGTFNLNTTQLVLHEDGAIGFTYDGIDARVDEGLRGLYPGGPDPPLEVVRFSEFLPDRQTLRLEPDGRETYHATLLPSRFNPDLGENLGLGDDDNATVSLGFTFPFYDTHWNEVHVGANGVVAFGGNINPPESERYRPLRDFYNELPKIAPFFIDLNPSQGGGVFYRREADKATITWHQVPQFGTLQRSTVQLVLHQRGTIDFTYDGIVDLAYDWSEAQLLIGGVWGLHPGGSDPRLEPVGLAEALPYQGPARAGLVEDFRLQYRRFVHRRMLPFVYVVLGTTLFILVVFPFFFRTSLIKPLEALLRGVQRVNTGDLAARVPVRVNDEIGILAQNFNRMTTSLKSAEEQLKAYAEGLEEKVADRTADLQQALHHLTQTQDQLIHAEKMASLGSLTAGIAHEIKNPLNFINNFSQLSVELADELVQELEANQGRPLAEVLDRVQDLLDDLKANAERIHEHGQRADGIVRNMLEHSRSVVGERRAVDVNGLLEEYLKLAYHRMRASTPDFDVTMEKDLDASVGAVEMAPQEIGRVFINLLNNAFYAVHKQARSSDGSYTPTVAVRTRRDGDHVEIRVRDNGPGIAPDFQEKIFEPFFTTKPTGAGTGLGLSLSYDIVTQGHGGTLTVESAEGEGATFVITLPV